MVFHGLAHGVLPLRGAGALSPDTWVNAFTIACYTVALIGFVTAGAGGLGVRPFQRLTWWLTVVAATASMIAFRMLGDINLWPGMLLDFALAIGASWLDAPPRCAQSFAIRSFRGWLPRVGQVAGLVFVAYVSAGTLLWPWHRHWGTTPAERVISLPGDSFERRTWRLG